MTTYDNTPAEMADRAAAWLEEHAWLQNGFALKYAGHHSHSSTVMGAADRVCGACALGALGVARYELAGTYEEFQTVALALEGLVTAELVEAGYEPAEPAFGLATWNDFVAQSKDVVVDKLRQVARVLRAEVA